MATKISKIIPKMCTTCTHFIRDAPTIKFGDKFGKCRLFGVGSVVDQRAEREYAIIVRKNNMLCGDDGEFYRQTNDDNGN